MNAKEFNTDKEIQLTVVQDFPEREIKGVPTQTNSGGGPIARSSIYQPVYAYIHSDVVFIVFEEIFSTVAVTVVNETTGITVYSETCSNPVTLDIDLNSESTDDYLIEIEVDGALLTGTFKL